MRYTIALQLCEWDLDFIECNSIQETSRIENITWKNSAFKFLQVIVTTRKRYVNRNITMYADGLSSVYHIQWWYPGSKTGNAPCTMFPGRYEGNLNWVFEDYYVWYTMSQDTVIEEHMSYGLQMKADILKARIRSFLASVLGGSIRCIAGEIDLLKWT